MSCPLYCPLVVRRPDSKHEHDPAMILTDQLGPLGFLSFRKDNPAEESGMLSAMDCCDKSSDGCSFSAGVPSQVLSAWLFMQSENWQPV